MKEEKNKSYLPTKFSLIIRLAVAAYLLYTVYSLRGAPGQYSGGERIMFIVFMIIFCVIAAALCYFSIKGLLTGKYVGGVLDVNAGQDAADTESDAETLQSDGIDTESSAAESKKDEEEAK